MEELNFSIVAYPNPTTSYIHLKVKSMKDEKLNYSLSGLKGIMLGKGKLDQNQVTIDLKGYKPSTYLLNIISNHEVIKSFKIIKSE